MHAWVAEHSELGSYRLLQTYIFTMEPKLAEGNQFLLPKLVRPDQFWQQKWSGGPFLTKCSAEISPAGPILV